MSEEDISSEWDTLKNVPRTKVTPLETDDLRMDILDAQHLHPDFIYRVHDGYGLETIALWRCKCFAKRFLKEKDISGNPIVKEVFLYTVDKLLAAGPGYTPHLIEARRYMATCSAFQTTLEDAIAEWERVKEKHIALTLEEATRHRNEAAAKVQLAEMLEKRAELARKRLTVDDFKEAEEKTWLMRLSDDD